MGVETPRVRDPRDRGKALPRCPDLRRDGDDSPRRYFDWRISMSAPLSAHMPTMAAVLAPLLSIVIFSNTLCRSMARSENRLAAARLRCARNWEVDRVARAADRAGQALPLAVEFDLGFVRSPARACWPLAPTKHHCQRRQQRDLSLMNRGVVDDDATLGHHFIDLPQAQRMVRLPANAHQRTHTSITLNGSRSRFKILPAVSFILLLSIATAYAERLAATEPDSRSLSASFGYRDKTRVISLHNRPSFPCAAVMVLRPRSAADCQFSGHKFKLSKKIRWTK